MSQALSGINVLEFAAGWTGAALCGRMLAELGAEVIKVEPPGGDALRHRPPEKDSGGVAFSMLSAGKRSAALDLTLPEDRTRARDMALRSDVVLDGLPFGALDECGLGSTQLRTDVPKLIYCAISTFGRTGPLRGWAGSDLLAQAMSGLMSTTGFADGPPTRAGVPLGEHAAGAMATSAILAALFHRLDSKTGQDIDISALDCLFMFQSSFVPSLFLGKEAALRQGFRHPLMAPWDVYRTQDSSVVICSGNDNHWRAMLNLFDRNDLLVVPHLATVQERVRHVEEVNDIVEVWTSQHATEDVIAAMHSIGVPAGPILDVERLFEHQQFRERELMLNIGQPDRRDKVIGSLFKMSRTAGRPAGPAPALGDYQESRTMVK
jgi:crotonobetainyl-CoA:carnitine CoA-transferase CaiB-like acyl-CoA transferase